MMVGLQLVAQLRTTQSAVVLTEDADARNSDAVEETQDGPEIPPRMLARMG